MPHATYIITHLVLFLLLGPKASQGKLKSFVAMDEGDEAPISSQFSRKYRK